MLEYETLEEMRDTVARHVQETNTSSITGVNATRINEAINLVYSGLVRKYTWPNLLDGKESGFTSTAGEKFVYLPKYVGQLYFFLTSQLQEVAPAEAIMNFMNKRGAFKDDSFPIEAFAPAGEMGRKTDWHTAAETVEVSGGTSTYDCLIHGRTGDDDEVFETVAVTSGNAANSTTSWEDIYAVSLNGAHTSVVTITGNDSSKVYATIAPNERTARYRRVRISGVNSTAETLSMYFKKKVARLNDDDQVPEIPASPAIIHKAIALFYSHQRKWEAAMNMHLGLAEEAIRDVLNEELMQGFRIEQGVPLSARNGPHGTSRRIVVNN